MESGKKTKTEFEKAPAIVKRFDPEYFRKVKALFQHSHFAREGANLPEKFKQILVMAVAAAADGYFLERHVFSHVGRGHAPASRARLVERMARRAQAEEH